MEIVFEEDTGTGDDLESWLDQTMSMTGAPEINRPEPEPETEVLVPEEEEPAVVSDEDDQLKTPPRKNVSSSKSPNNKPKTEGQKLYESHQKKLDEKRKKYIRESPEEARARARARNLSYNNNNKHQQGRPQETARTSSKRQPRPASAPPKPMKASSARSSLQDRQKAAEARSLERMRSSSQRSVSSWTMRPPPAIQRSTKPLTRPKSPRLATSHIATRRQRAASLTPERNNGPKSDRYQSTTGFGSRSWRPTTPHAPHFALDDKYGEKTTVPSSHSKGVAPAATEQQLQHNSIQPNDSFDSRSVTSSRSSSVGSRRFKPTVPRAPKFATTERLGDTKGSLGRSPSAFPENASGRSARSSYSSNRGASSWKPTRTKEFSFALDDRLGKKELAREDSSSSQRSLQMAPSSDYSVVSHASTVGSRHFRPTVPKAPSFHTDARLGESRRSSSTRSQSVPPSSDQSVVSTATSKVGSRRFRPTIPKGPSFLLDQKYGEKTLSPARSTASASKPPLSSSSNNASVVSSSSKFGSRSFRVTVPKSPTLSLERKYGNKYGTSPASTAATETSSTSSSPVAPRTLY